MYFIEEGKVSIRIQQDAGEVEISNLEKGQYFGELALVTHRPRAASAYAVDNVKVACKYPGGCPFNFNAFCLYALMHAFNRFIQLANGRCVSSCLLSAQFSVTNW